MRLHPIRVIHLAATLSLMATWVLALSGFAFGQPRLYAWAGRMLIVTLVVAMTPLLTSVIAVAIERIRGDRP